MARFNDEKVSNQSKVTQSDGIDVEFSPELADHDDLEAQARSRAADARAKARKSNS